MIHDDAKLTTLSDLVSDTIINLPDLVTAAEDYAIQRVRETPGNENWVPTEDNEMSIEASMFWTLVAAYEAKVVTHAVSTWLYTANLKKKKKQ